ncbi:MAG: PAS domain S-box protein [Candidatus Bipolaricaulota bacterium]
MSPTIKDLKRLFKYSPEALFLEDLDGNILDVNTQACELLGYDKQELLELKVEDIVPEGAPVFHPDQIDQATKMGKPIETINLRKDGTEIPVVLRGKMVDREGEELILVSLRECKVQGEFRELDISLEDYLDSSLPSLLSLQSEDSPKQKVDKILEWQKALFEGSRDAIFISDEDSQFIAVNSAACDLTGYSKQELLQMSIPDLHDDVDLQAYEDYHDKILEGENVVSTAKILRKNGEKVVTEFNSNRIQIDDVPYMYTSARDITERKKAERQLRQSEEKFKSFLNSTADLAFLKDENFVHIMANDAYLEFLNAEREEVIGKTDFELLPQELAESCRESDRKALQEDEPITAEERSGDKVFESRKFPVKLTDDTIGVGGIIRDITERKQVARKLQEERNKLRSLHEAVDELQRQGNEEDVAWTAIEVAENMLEFELCDISVVEGDYLVPKANSMGLNSEEAKKFEIGEGIAGITVQNGETIWGDDLSNYPEAEPTSEDFKSFISAPIGDIGVMQVISKEEGSFEKRDVELAEILAGHLSEEIKRVHLEEELRQQAIRDPLTGLYNRRYFSGTLQKEVERSKRYGEKIGFVMMDVNRFKEINDHYSHQIGDKVLKEVAELLKENVRDADTVVRYGGDEFLIMMPEMEGKVNVMVDRIKRSIEKWNENSSLLDFPLTVAVGVSLWSPEQDRDIEEALKQVDRRMYKDKGR